MWRECALMVSMLVLGGCGAVKTYRATHAPLRVEQVSTPVRIRETAAGRARGQAIELASAAAERLGNGDLAGAEADARRALKAHPDSASALNVLGLIAMQRGKTADAGRWFAQAANQPSAGASEWSNYGVWLCAAGQNRDALPWLDRAIAQQGRDGGASTLANRARCALSAGQTEGVEQQLRAVLDSEPANAVALSTLAQYMYQRGQMMEARAFSQRLLAQPAVDATDLQLAARIERALGDEAAARRIDTRLQSATPSTPR